MEELNKPASAKVNPTTAPAMVAPAATTASTITAPQGDPDFQGNKVATDNAKTARMREALRLRMATLPEPAPTPIRTAAGMTFSPTPFANIPGPASPLSGAKQERLAELLQRYKMDAITPLDYHTQRAKIIAEP
jgi:hypothetical protein